MSDFFYSDDALNIMDCFHSVDKVVYVEGDDDVVFWEIIFTKLSTLNVEIKSVGGLEELKKYIHKVESGEVDSFIARDSDFSFLDEQEQSDKVIYTYAHSIENTLVCSNTLSKIIKTHARLAGNQQSKAECDSWITNFSNDFKSLVFFDVTNEVEGLGFSVLGNNCTKFMQSKNSPHADILKIEKYIDANNLADLIPINEENLTLKISKCSREIVDFIRGHFLFSGAIKYVNSQIKGHSSSKTTSNDGFFSNSMLAFESIFNDQHPHFEHYRDQILRAEQAAA